MKTLSKINLILYILTPLFYITYLYGLLFQIALGFYQVLISMYFTYKYFNYDNYKIKLLTYWLLAITSLILVVLRDKIGLTGEYSEIIIVSLIPMFIATYNVTLNYKLYKYEL